MSTSAQNKIVEEIRKDLFSGDDLTVMKAVLRCKEEGTAALIQPLIAIFCTSKNQHIRAEIYDMLSSLKVSGAEEIFMEALANKAYRTSRKDLLTCIWSANLQPVEGVVLLTEIAVEGDFEEAVECLTIIENLEDEVAEGDLLEASSIARTFITSFPNDPKVSLIADLLVALENRTEA